MCAAACGVVNYATPATKFRPARAYGSKRSPEGSALGMNVTMKTHEFTIIVSGDGDDTGLTDRLFEAGCDDSTISSQNGVLVIEFDRIADNFAHAAKSAMADVRKADVEILHICEGYSFG